MIRLELIKGKKGESDFMLIVRFEDTGKGCNFRKEDLTWVPSFEELETIMLALKKIQLWK